MKWKHIVIEGHCFFEPKKNTLPENCKFGAGNLSPLCFGEEKYCTFLGIGTAKASLVVTDSNGIAVNGTCFFSNSKLTSEKWDDEEKKWIGKQANYIEQI